MPKDDDTLKFYANEADTYITWSKKPNHQRLGAFLAKIPSGGAILELGCGAGKDSEYMISKGFAVTPTDGAPEIANAAQKRLEILVTTLLFNDLNEKNKFDGIWANACLLRVPRSDLAAIVNRIHSALKSGGCFYASFKTGQNGTQIQQPRQ